MGSRSFFLSQLLSYYLQESDLFFSPEKREIGGLNIELKPSPRDTPQQVPYTFFSFTDDSCSIVPPVHQLPVVTVTQIVLRLLCQ